MKNWLFCWLIIAAAFLQAGCASVKSNIYFANPAQTKVTLPDRNASFVMPTMAALKQTEGSGKMHRDEGGEPIYMELPDGTRLKGYLYVFHCNSIRRKNPVLDRIQPDGDRPKVLKSGRVTVTALSAKGKPVYKNTRTGTIANLC
jgi:hypothetical protein